MVVSLTKAQEVELSVSEINTFKEQVNNTAQKSNTIVNEFVQLKHIDFLSNDIESSGDLYFKKPNIIKWSYTNPYQYSVIFRDKKLFINDSGKKSDLNLGTNKIFEKLNDLIAKSVSGDMLNDDQFTMSFFKKNHIYLVKLIPKEENLGSMFKQIELSFSKSDYLVSSVKLIEPSGDFTLINFKNKSINQPISNEVFVH